MYLKFLDNLIYFIVCFYDTRSTSTCGEGEKCDRNLLDVTYQPKSLMSLPLDANVSELILKDGIINNYFY